MNISKNYLQLIPSIAIDGALTYMTKIRDPLDKEKNMANKVTYDEGILELLDEEKHERDIDVDMVA